MLVKLASQRLLKDVPSNSVWDSANITSLTEISKHVVLEKYKTSPPKEGLNEDGLYTRILAREGFLSEGVLRLR